MDDLTFTEVPLVFVQALGENLFSLKNNATVERTLAHKRYQGLHALVAAKYPDKLHLPLGTFLHRLKVLGDPLYRSFLNPHGDGTFIRFRPQLGEFSKLKGLYRYTVGPEIVYVGLSLDSFGRRIGYGYGSISPKNCFLDGQSTNCHLNALIAQQWDEVRLSVCPLTNDDEIRALERQLIGQLQPQWNVQVKRSPMLA